MLRATANTASAVIVTAAASLLAVLGTLAVLAVACTPSAESAARDVAAVIGEEVSVTGGVIRGIAGEGDLRRYHGIPYVAPPTGERRWAPPGALEPWEGMLDASASGPACPQPAGPEGGFYTGERSLQSEDCLTLNVWTEAGRTSERRPVMVWVHGGSLIYGTGSDYDGTLLASKGVVLVTINYRLGRFGFLAHPELTAESGSGASGNQGLRDQIAALEWVRDNAAAFGGDPDNVTIFGESAGSYSMSLLQASPLARGLFHRVIGQSGGAFQPMWRRAEATSYAISAEELGRKFGKALVGDGEADLAAMRARSMDEVLTAFRSDPAFSDYGSLAIVDGELIPREVATIFAAGEQADVPVMIGSNADEGSTFLSYFEPALGSGIEGWKAYVTATLPEADDDVWAAYPAANEDEARRAWIDFFSDTSFAYPMRAWARGMETVPSNAYLYWFTWSPPVPETEKYGAFHAGEIGYVFGTLAAFGAVPTEADREFSATMSDIWVRFATSGDPNGDDFPAWPAFTRDNEAYMELGPTLRSGQRLRMEQMELIDEAFARRRSGG